MSNKIDDKYASQPMPAVNNSKFIQDMVIEDMLSRKKMGIEKYGTALQAGNGRDALQDAYEESLDLCMYLKQAIVERDSKKADNDSKILAKIQSGEIHD